MTVDEVLDDLHGVAGHLEHVQFLAHKLRRRFFAFLFWRQVMAISDDITAITAKVQALDAQAPGAITAALAAATAAGGDPNAPAAVIALGSAVDKLTADLQAAVSGA